MNISLEQGDFKELEIVVRYHKNNDELKNLLSLLALREKRIATASEGKITMVSPTEVLYCEIVDGNVFVYTKSSAERTLSSLQELEDTFSYAGFMRCSKSMVVNIHFISTLESQIGGRILATLYNSERIIISRHYACILRQRILK